MSNSLITIPSLSFKVTHGTVDIHKGLSPTLARVEMQALKCLLSVAMRVTFAFWITVLQKMLWTALFWKSISVDGGPLEDLLCLGCGKECLCVIMSVWFACVLYNSQHTYAFIMCFFPIWWIMSVYCMCLHAPHLLIKALITKITKDM